MMTVGGISVITLHDIQLAQDVAEELRARGARDKAAAIENIISTAAPALSAKPKDGPRQLFTTGQAARALGVSVQTIKNWASSGQLQTIRLGGRVMVHRDALLAYLDARRRAQPAGKMAEAEAEKDDAQREFVYAGFPIEQIERIRALTGKLEAGEPLSKGEGAEMLRLESDFARISRERLKLWLDRKRPAASA
jgi:excisionase family DNA binding protein